MEQFGKYQLLRRIGAGGMAEVFLARTAVAQGLAKDLVIKKIHSSHDRSPHFVSMFVDEAKIALGLNHPNIVQVFDFGQVGDTFFLAMEYIAGVDLLRVLQEILKQKRRIPIGLCAYFVQEMAKGLDYAHRKVDEFGEPLGIVHRDVSPQNALVSWDGVIKIVDFGIARARGIQDEEGVVKGKYSYMAPEQARGQSVDRRADVYSAGVVLFELCCARPLFPGRGKQVLAKVKAGHIPSPRSINADIPEGLESIMLNALATNPGDRYATARELQVALSGFQFEQARSAADIIDAETVASFLKEVIPEQERQPVRDRSVRVPVISNAGDSASEDDSVSESGSPVPLPIERFDNVNTNAEDAPPIAEVRTRKHVVVLEGHVRGLETLQEQLGVNRAQRVIEQFFEVASDIAFKHESYVHEAEGNNITVLVGLPVAREDDASRTIRLGLALSDALDGIGRDVIREDGPSLRLSIGVQRGNAVVVYRDNRAGKAELDASERMMARRLAKAAPGADILVGSQVQRVAKADWYFDSILVDNLTSSDDGQQATAYRLRGPKERAARLLERENAVTEVIGRDLEMKALRDAYRDVLNTSKIRQILLFGEAGVGKRTIVNRFVASIPKGEAVIMRAATQVATAYTPYALIADLARDMLGLTEDASLAEIQRRANLMMPLLYPGETDSRQARAVMAALCVLLGAQSDTEGLDADELRERIADVVIRIQKRMQPEKPIIVIGEDMHWADDESVELFRHLMELPRRRATLGIVTSRPEPRLQRVADDLGADVMHIGELNPEASMRLITQRFAQDTEPADAPAVNQLAEQIIARTGGNPFFIREVIDSLIDRGIITVQSWSSHASQDASTGDSRHGLLRWVSRDAPIQVPTSVESLLSTRIDRLPLAQKQVLIQGAVFGRTFTTESVTKLIGRSVRDDLNALVERGLLFSGTEDHFSFRNDMSMSVAYGLLPAEDRSNLHQQVAEIIQTSSSYGEGKDSAVVARHLELAGDASQAADRYVIAASHAIDVGGNGDALRLLDRALKLLAADDHERLYQVNSRREHILVRLGQRSQCRQALDAMLRSARALGQPTKLAEAYIRDAEAHLHERNPQDAARSIEPAFGYARAAGDSIAQADALRLRATVARTTGDNEQALVLCEQALALCDDSPRGYRARALIINSRGGALWTMGRLEESIESFAETLVIYRMLELPREESKALNNMGIVFSVMGEHEEALAHYKSSLEINRRLGDRASFASKLSNIGQSYIDLGDSERAEKYLRKAHKLAEQMDDIAAIIDVVISLGHVHLQKRNFERARVTLARGLSLSRAHEERYQEIRAVILSSMNQLASGDHATALELAHYGTEVAKKMPMPVGHTYGLVLQGLASARLSKLSEAVAFTNEAVALLMQQERPESPDEILYYHARVCEQAGLMEDAANAITSAYRELTDKIVRLNDPDLLRIYQASRIPRSIVQAYERLIGPVTS